MKSLKGLALFLAAFALPAFVAPQLRAQLPATCGTQTIPLCSAGGGSGALQIKPQAVPTSTAVVAATDAYLKTVTVANTTSGALTFSLCDRQASPVCVTSAVSIAANTSYILTWLNLYWCPNGFTVAASGTGLVFYAAFNQ